MTSEIEQAAKEVAEVSPTTAMVPPGELQKALLTAVGFDKLSAPQRELALAICRQYGLDPILKHVVMIEGRAYITRDGLLHVAHKSGVFDGIEVDQPTLDEDGKYWRSKAAVWRKDMRRPFIYPGRYPADGQNKKYAEEMAIKVAEVMTLRRAFDVAAPVVEEKWADEEHDDPEVEKPMSVTERIAERAAQIQEHSGIDGPMTGVEAPADGTTVEISQGTEPSIDERRFSNEPTIEEIDPQPVDAPAEAVKDLGPTHGPSDAAEPTEAEFCGDKSPLSGEACNLDKGHKGVHRAGLRESW